MLAMVAVHPRVELRSLRVVLAALLNDDSSDGLHVVRLARRVVPLHSCRGKPALILQQGTQFLMSTTA